MNGFEPADADALFERALVSEDEAYDLAEGRLRETADTAALERHLTHPDPIARLMARVVLESIDENASDDFAKADAYLSYVDRRFKGTVAGAPPVDGVVDNLSEVFGGRLADFAALRLVKESEPPPWRALSMLGYLERHGTPATTEAVIRYAAKTSIPELQHVAARVLTGIGDPALAQKLAAERERLARAGQQLPPVVAALAAPGGGAVA